VNWAGPPNTSLADRLRCRAVGALAASTTGQTSDLECLEALRSSTSILRAAEKLALSRSVRSYVPTRPNPSQSDASAIDLADRETLASDTLAPAVEGAARGYEVSTKRTRAPSTKSRAALAAIAAAIASAAIFLWQRF
jgi:hypothetical protein